MLTILEYIRSVYQPRYYQEKGKYLHRHLTMTRTVGLSSFLKRQHKIEHLETEKSLQPYVSKTPQQYEISLQHIATCTYTH